MSKGPFAIVWTTVGQHETAKDMARALVEAHLAACVQITQIDSIYRWEGAIEEAGEWLLSCKVAAENFSAIEAAISARHPYDVPEIVMAPIVAGSNLYLRWLDAETRLGTADQS